MPRLLELFSGTGSVGKEWEYGEVVSVDVAGKAPTHQCDILKWDYTIYPPGHFDVVWASPPCTQYSVARTKAKTPRDLEGADALVRKALEIIEYFGPRFFFMENPWTGMLRHREVVAALPPPKKVSYCKYGAPYQKHTAIWTNAADLELACCRRDCGSMVVSDRGFKQHRGTAQHGPLRNMITIGFPQDQLYSIPPLLCRKICEHVGERLGQPEPPAEDERGDESQTA